MRISSLAGLVLTFSLLGAGVALGGVSGDLDRGFTGDGQLLTEFESGNSAGVLDAAVDANGRLVVAGSDGAEIGVARFNPDGSFDTSFGGDGSIVIDSGATTGGERARSVAVDPITGNILVLGDASIAAGGDTSDLVLARVLPSGTLDDTFDGPGTPGNGRFRLDFDDSEFGQDVLPIASSELAFTANLGAGSTGKVRIAQLTSTGAFDTPDFGSGSFDFQWAANTHSFATGLARQSDGKFVVAGFPNATATYGVARILQDGSGLDTSFNAAGSIPGIARPALPSGFISARALDVVIDTNGITVAGNAQRGSPSFDHEAILSRVSDAGALVTTFGNSSGDALFSPSADDDESFSSLSSLDGRLFAGGIAPTGGASPYFRQLAALYTSAGVLDTTFAPPNGFMTSDLGVTSTVVSAPVAAPPAPNAGVAYLAGLGGSNQIAVSAVCLLVPPACPAPEMPVVQSVSPASGSNDNFPRVRGVVPPRSTPPDATVISVGIYRDAACTNLVGSGTQAAFEGAGVPVSVTDNSSTTFYAAAIGNGTSPCSTTSVSYSEVTPPAVPATSVPAAPAPAPKKKCKKKKKKGAAAAKKCKKKPR